MPSPTSSTRPTSRLSMPTRTSRICSSMMREISSALNAVAMLAPLLEIVRDPVDPGAHAGVVDVVADAYHQPAQDVGVDLQVQDRFPAEGLPQVARQPGALV